jgi:hypothetical protein
MIIINIQILDHQLNIFRGLVLHHLQRDVLQVEVEHLLPLLFVVRDKADPHLQNIDVDLFLNIYCAVVLFRVWSFAAAAGGDGLLGEEGLVGLIELDLFCEAELFGLAVDVFGRDYVALF